MLNVTSARVLRSGLFCVLSALAVMPASAASRLVAAGGDLQGALNQAQGGDTITIAAGAKFTGHFTLPPNNSGKWITIQSSAMSSLPAAGNRVSPAQAQYMPKLVTPDASQALAIPSGANYYRIQGIEITVASGVYVNDLILAGTGGETATSQLPHDLDFDRDYIHGDPVSGGKRGLALNSATATVENSYFAAFTSGSQDTQAICGWNGSGPFTITNNHLEAGTEIVAFGGATPAINGLVPSNIVIQNNEFYKPLSWWSGSSNYAGTRVWAKNHLELKNAKNVTIQNNTFTNNFVGADQLGFMLVLNVRDEGGQVPWATVSNVTVKNNLFQHTAAGVLFMGHDGDGGGTAGSFSFSNNVFNDLGGYGGDGRMYEILNDVRGITLDHETAFPTGWLMVFAEGASSNVKVTNSIFANGWGIGGDGTSPGNPTMTYYNPGGRFANNAVIGANAAQYTGSYFANNSFPGSQTNVGFMDYNGGNFLLAANSPYKSKATDGLDLGSNLQTVSGQSSAPVVPTGWVNIVSKNSGKCLDIIADGSGSIYRAGTYAQQWACWGGDMQKFQFTPVPGGYEITNKSSGLQLDMEGGPSNTTLGARLLQWPYWGGTNEIFKVNPTPDGYVTLNPVHSGVCLDVAGVSKDNGAMILQWTCWGGDNQKWTLVPAQ